VKGVWSLGSLYTAIFTGIHPGTWPSSGSLLHFNGLNRQLLECWTGQSDRLNGCKLGRRLPRCEPGPPQKAEPRKAGRLEPGRQDRWVPRRLAGCKPTRLEGYKPGKGWSPSNGAKCERARKIMAPHKRKGKKSWLLIKEKGKNHGSSQLLPAKSWLLPAFAGKIMAPPGLTTAPGLRLRVFWA